MDIDQISFGIKASASKASASLERLVQSLDKLNDAFARVQTSGTGAITTLNGIVSASAGIKTGLKGASTSAKTTSTAMKQVTATTRQTSTALNTMRARLKRVGSAMVGVNRDTKNATSGMSRLIQKITQITFVVYVARRALRAFGQGIQASIAYVENLNLFMVALGENTSRATGFIKEMSESLYLDEAQLTRVQGLFYQISEALGLSSDKAYTLSENFTKLAYDLASFYNITIEDAVTKLQAGLVGETEPLRRIGIIITENNLAETARNLGIKKSIRNMTEMEKIQLRYVTALQQTKNAQGDLARTLEQPENLLRILREQFHVLMRELGNVAIPIIKELIPQVIGLTMALSDLARQMAKTLGYEAPEIRDDLGGFMKTVADESNDIEKSTDNTQKNWAKILKYTRDSASAMTGIDELNVLSDDESGLTGASIDDLFPTADDVKSQIDLGIDDYNNNMEASKGIFDDIILQWKNLFTEIGNVFETTKTAVKGLWEEVFGGSGSEDSDRLVGLRIMNEIITGIVTGVTDMVVLFKSLYTDALKPIFELIAPDWMVSLGEGTDGELAKVVSFLTKAFITWKAIKISASLIGLFSKLITVGGLIGGATGLLALIGALAGIKIGLDVADAIVTGDWSDVKKTLEDAIILGLGATVVTGSPLAGVIAFSIGTLIEFNIEDIMVKAGDLMFKLFDELLVKPLDFLLNNLVGAINKALKIVNIFIPGEDWDAQLLPYFNLSERLNDALDPKPKHEPIGVTWQKGGMAYDANTAVLNQMPAGQITPNFGQGTGQGQEQAEKVPTVAETVAMVLEKVNIPALSDSLKRFIEDNFYAIVLHTLGKNKKLTDPFAIVGAINELGWSGEYANGGVPKKGNLFVAGEKGPELVTEHNGETVVMNEQQLKDRGISLYADGTNVPKAGPFHELRDSSMSADWENMTSGFEKAIDGLVNRFGSISAIIDTTYVAFKTLTVVGIGTLINSFNKFANSKSFQTLFKSAPAEGGTTLQQQEAMGGMIGATLGEGPAGQIFALAQHIADGTVGKFLESAPLMIEAGVDFLENLLVGMVEAMPAIIKAIPEVIGAIVGVFTNKDSLNMIIESLVLITASIVQAIPDIIFALVDAIPDVVRTLIEVFIENIPLFLKLGVAIGVAILEGLANILIGGINAIIDSINWLIPGKRWDIDKIGKADFSAMIPKFADGGFPQQGQMFIAREAGAELVGNIGGSTAVANNDQIVTAVSDGVYRAVSQAMGEQGGQRVSLRVDGRRMSEAMDLASKKRGLAFGTGGY